jgi:hypothetical protein
MADSYNKVGRPTVYREEFCEEVVKNCMMGNWSATEEQIGDFFGVTRQTVANWKEQHPEFLCAVKRAKLLTDNRVEGCLFHQATSGNVTAQIFWLKNRRPGEWREKQDVDLRTPDGIQLSAIDASRFAGMTDEQIQEARKKIQEAIEIAQKLQIEGGK